MKGCTFSDIYLAASSFYRNCSPLGIQYKCVNLYHKCTIYEGMIHLRSLSYIYFAFASLIMYLHAHRGGAGNKKYRILAGIRPYRSAGLRFHLINSIQIQFPAVITMSFFFFTRKSIRCLVLRANLILSCRKKCNAHFPKDYSFHTRARLAVNSTAIKKFFGLLMTYFCIYISFLRKPAWKLNETSAAGLNEFRVLRE